MKHHANDIKVFVSEKFGKSKFKRPPRTVEGNYVRPASARNQNQLRRNLLSWESGLSQINIDFHKFDPVTFRKLHSTIDNFVKLVTLLKELKKKGLSHKQNKTIEGTITK